MKNWLVILMVLVAWACSNGKPSAENSRIDSVSIDSLVTDPARNSEEDNGCIFNNNYEVLTIEWLSELGIRDSIQWNKSLQQAVLPIGHDTLFVSKGGCEHFTTSVTWRLYKDHANLNDHELWLTRALDLSKKFKLDHYETMIEENLAKALPSENNKTIWFEIPDDEESDNLYYAGIEVMMTRKYNEIKLSQYYN